MKWKSFRIIAFILLTVSASLSAEDILYGDVMVSTRTEPDSDEYFTFKAGLGLEMDLAKRMEANIALRLNEFQVKPDEITITIKVLDLFNIRPGYKENHMTLDEMISGFDRPIHTKNLLSEYYSYLGYVSRYAGLEFYHNYKEDESSLPLSWHLKAGYSYVYLNELQCDGGIWYHPFGEDSYLGFSGVYIRDDVLQSEDFEHHLAFSFLFCDLEGPLIYSLETAFGSNYPSPISYFALPSGDLDKSYFWGFDVLFGWRMAIRKMLWIPALRYSLLIPDTGSAEYFKQQIVFGNQLYLSKNAKIFADLQWTHIKPYEDLSGDDNLYELVLTVGIHVSTDGFNFKQFLRENDNEN